MENIVSEIKVKHLQLKLSGENLHIKTMASSETFALSSIHEIHIIDLVDEFNKSFTQHIKKRSSAFGIMITGIILFLVGMVLKIWLISLSGILPLILGIKQLNNLKDPTLKSSLRLIMTHGNRDFEFYKLDNGSTKIDEFIFKVDSILNTFKNKI